MSSPVVGHREYVWPPGGAGCWPAALRPYFWANAPTRTRTDPGAARPRRGGVRNWFATRRRAGTATPAPRPTHTNMGAISPVARNITEAWTLGDAYARVRNATVFIARKKPSRAGSARLRRTDASSGVDASPRP